MDWIKIHHKHISNSLSFAEVGLLVKYQLLIARLERIPTDRELRLEFDAQKLFDRLSVKLQLLGVSVSIIAQKVLEDVSTVVQVRSNEKHRKAQQRTKNQNVPRDVAVVDKIREDKIREDIPLTPMGHLTDNFELSNCASIGQFYSFVRRSSLTDAKKKELDILLGSTFKSAWDIKGIHELIDAFLKEKPEIERVTQGYQKEDKGAGVSGKDAPAVEYCEPSEEELAELRGDYDKPKS